MMNDTGSRAMELEENAAVFGQSETDDAVRLFVAIGASAGGLDALEVFFANMPKVDGFVFVVIQHQSADHDSHLAQILEPKSGYPIKVITDRMPLEDSCVFVTPPGVQVKIHQNQFRLRAITQEERPPFTINHFLHSLAEECGERAAAIILSGSGTDGAKGVVEVHGAGGAVLVQDAQSARFDGMPLSAVAMGSHDLIARVEDMPDALLRLKATGSPLRAKSLETDLQEDCSALDEIAKVLRSVDGVDFSEYKTGTIIRRIERRMVINRFHSVEAYIKYLNSNKEELDLLHTDLLIGVTRFFRDPLFFQALERRVMGELAQRMGKGQSIRVWVPACSTGEEVFSIAMMLHEHMEKIEPQPEVKIFATDVHPGSLAAASIAMYHDDALVDLSEGRVEQHFERDGDKWRIGAHLRQMVVFTRHNLLLDPPFTNIDLVSCRNLIMYFEEKAQKQAIGRIHFAMRPHGFAFLGSAEQVTHFCDEFTTVDRSARIYRKRRDVKLVDISPLPTLKAPAARWPRATRPPTRSLMQPEAMRSVFDSVIEKLVPAGFIVDQDGQLLHTIGDVKRYLTIKPGPMRANIYDMLEHEFKTALLTLVLRAERLGSPVEQHNVQVSAEEDAKTIDLFVHPLSKDRAGLQQLLVRIERSHNTASPSASDGTDCQTDPIYVRQLNEELELTRRSLREMTEEVGARNEELQAVNEEVMASNAELQTTNEELQSVNEELHTVNSEYQRKISELEVLTDDMSNLLVSTEIGTIFADVHLRIRQFTDSVKEFFPLRRSDIGRPLDELASRLGYFDIEAATHKALHRGESRTLEIQDQQDRWFQLRVLPYRRQNRQIDGVVLAFIDIDSVKRAEIDAERERERFRAIVEDQDELVCRFDPSLKLTFVNDAYCRYFDRTSQELLGQSILGPMSSAHHSSIRSKISSIPPGQSRTNDQEISAAGHIRWQRWTDRAIADENGNIIEYQSVGHDITEYKQVLKELKQSADYLTDLVKNTPALLAFLNFEDAIIDLSAMLTSKLGYEHSEMVGRQFTHFMTENSRVIAENHLRTVEHGARCFDVPYEFLTKDRTIVPLLMSAVASDKDSGSRHRLQVILQ